MNKPLFVIKQHEIIAGNKGANDPVYQSLLRVSNAVLRKVILSVDEPRKTRRMALDLLIGAKVREAFDNRGPSNGW